MLTGIAESARIRRSVAPSSEYDLPKKSSNLSFRIRNAAIAGIRMSRHNPTDFMVLDRSKLSLWDPLLKREYDIAMGIALGQ
jgi:hypothetical protein